jgi:hypothetical protein
MLKLALTAADSYLGTKMVDDIGKQNEAPERVRTVVRIAKIGRGRSEDGEDWETVDLPGKFARFSPL